MGLNGELIVLLLEDCRLEDWEIVPEYNIKACFKEVEI